MTINTLVKLNIYEIKTSNCPILINNQFLLIDIEYILLSSTNSHYKLKFYNIYENLIFSLSVSLNNFISYTNKIIIINTI